MAFSQSALTANNEEQPSGDFKAFSLIPQPIVICSPETLEITFANEEAVNNLSEHDLSVENGQTVGDLFNFDSNLLQRWKSDELPDQNFVMVQLNGVETKLSISKMQRGMFKGSYYVVSWSSGISHEVLMNVVDQLPINVMLCDPNDDFKITYMNGSSKKILKELEDLLPVKVDEILGKSFDIFHKNPSHQRNLVGNKNNLPYSGRIKLKDEVLELNVFPIIGADGAYNLALLSWSVITDKVENEKKVDMLMKAIESLPINVMLCDPNDDFKITYMNGQSYTTLQSVKHLLPIPVDQIVGQSFDVFHSNPKHQRNLVGNPANLPYRAKIKLGDEILDLNVSAITNEDGQYVCALLSWSVITEQENVAKQVTEAVTVVNEASDMLAQTSTDTRGRTSEMSNQANNATSEVENLGMTMQTVAAASEELSSSIREISHQTAQSAGLVQKTVEVVSSAQTIVQQLEEVTRKVSGVVVFIESIASQTNLLSLNATIEASRAGEAGRGFSVVASEVKSLANQTSAATQGIQKEVEQMQRMSLETTKSLSEISEAVSEINNVSSLIAAAAEEQSAATNEIACQVQSAASATSAVRETITTVSRFAEEIAKDTDIIQSKAKTLGEQSNSLDTAVESMLND